MEAGGWLGGGRSCVGIEGPRVSRPSAAKAGTSRAVPSAGKIKAGHCPSGFLLSVMALIRKFGARLDSQERKDGASLSFSDPLEVEIAPLYNSPAAAFQPRPLSSDMHPRTR